MLNYIVEIFSVINGKNNFGALTNNRVSRGTAFCKIEETSTEQVIENKLEEITSLDITFRNEVVINTTDQILYNSEYLDVVSIVDVDRGKFKNVKCRKLK